MAYQFTVNGQDYYFDGTDSSVYKGTAVTTYFTVDTTNKIVKVTDSSVLPATSSAGTVATITTTDGTTPADYKFKFAFDDSSGVKIYGSGAEWTYNGSKFSLANNTSINAGYAVDDSGQIIWKKPPTKGKTITLNGLPIDAQGDSTNWNKYVTISGLTLTLTPAAITALQPGSSLTTGGGYYFELPSTELPADTEMATTYAGKAWGKSSEGNVYTYYDAGYTTAGLSLSNSTTTSTLTNSSGKDTTRQRFSLTFTGECKPDINKDGLIEGITVDDEANNGVYTITIGGDVLTQLQTETVKIKLDDLDSNANYEFKISGEDILTEAPAAGMLDTTAVNRQTYTLGSKAYYLFTDNTLSYTKESTGAAFTISGLEGKLEAEAFSLNDKTLTVTLNKSVLYSENEHSSNVTATAPADYNVVFVIGNDVNTGSSTKDPTVNGENGQITYIAPHGSAGFQSSGDTVSFVSQTGGETLTIMGLIDLSGYTFSVANSGKITAKKEGAPEITIGTVTVNGSTFNVALDPSVVDNTKAIEFISSDSITVNLTKAGNLNAYADDSYLTATLAKKDSDNGTYIYTDEHVAANCYHTTTSTTENSKGRYIYEEKTPDASLTSLTIRGLKTDAITGTVTGKDISNYMTVDGNTIKLTEKILPAKDNITQSITVSYNTYTFSFPDASWTTGTKTDASFKNGVFKTEGISAHYNDDGTFESAVAQKTFTFKGITLSGDVVLKTDGGIDTYTVYKRGADQTDEKNVLFTCTENLGSYIFKIGKGLLESDSVKAGKEFTISTDDNTTTFSVSADGYSTEENVTKESFTITNDTATYTATYKPYHSDAYYDITSGTDTSAKTIRYHAEVGDTTEYKITSSGLDSRIDDLKKALEGNLTLTPHTIESVNDLNSTNGVTSDNDGYIFASGYYKITDTIKLNKRIFIPENATVVLDVAEGVTITTDNSSRVC
ncbi:MAG: hypothetical protein SR2Q5_07245 [Quinella sp. 2Q5]|nr:hypothetical protein [Quinella sp. 2Q5]